jgi:hypothetical protein
MVVKFTEQNLYQAKNSKESMNKAAETQEIESHSTQLKAI